MLTDSEDAAVVARDLGGLALALEQGGAYIAKIRVSFSEYRKRWESRKEEVLAWHDERLMQYPRVWPRLGKPRLKSCLSRSASC